MTKHAVIWDLDGTLLDSYPVIVNSIYQSFLKHGIMREKEEIHREIIAESVSYYMRQISMETGISYESMRHEYERWNTNHNHEIGCMAGAKEILTWLSEKGVENYVYTHRGLSTYEVLERLELKDYFREIITSEDGYARKPSPQAIDVLMERHDLKKEKTWYIGDRKLDMECAKNAGIHGILVESNLMVLKESLCFEK